LLTSSTQSRWKFPLIDRLAPKNIGLQQSKTPPPPNTLPFFLKKEHRRPAFNADVISHAATVEGLAEPVRRRGELSFVWMGAIPAEGIRPGGRSK